MMQSLFSELPPESFPATLESSPEDCNEVLDADDWTNPDPETYAMYTHNSETRIWPIGAITLCMRVTLGTWMAEVSAELSLSRSTYHLAVYLVDSYNIKAVPRLLQENYQLAGVAGLLIVSKLEEVSPPKLEQLRMACGNAYSLQEIRTMEREILSTCHWQVIVPTLHHWVVWLINQWDDFLRCIGDRSLPRFLEQTKAALALKLKALMLVDVITLDLTDCELKELAAGVVFVSVFSVLETGLEEFFRRFDYFLKRTIEVEDLSSVSCTFQYVFEFLSMPQLQSPVSEPQSSFTQTCIPNLAMYLKKRLQVRLMSSLISA